MASSYSKIVWTLSFLTLQKTHQNLLEKSNDIEKDLNTQSEQNNDNLEKIKAQKEQDDENFNTRIILILENEENLKKKVDEFIQKQVLGYLFRSICTLWQPRLKGT